ncbi:MAG: MarR family winged helix-turn-helix transcriptional regulator [bacterium]
MLNRRGCFVLSSRSRDVEGKIVAALERLSWALRVLLWDVAKEEGLSPIQIRFLLYLMGHSRELCRVSQLAREFGLTQPTVSDAVKSLVGKGLVCRGPWEGDGRVYTLELTPSGRSLAERISGWQSAVREQIERFPPDMKETAMIFLMELIKSLREVGIIEVARMCISCDHFLRDAHPGGERPHHCALTDTPLAVSELNVDCAMHSEEIGVR